MLSLKIPAQVFVLMATLFEYFKKDQGRSLAFDKTLEVRRSTGEPVFTFKGRLLIDFEANAVFVSFYIPSTTETAAAVDVIDAVSEVLSWRNEISVNGGYSGQELSPSSDAMFTGRVYIYSEERVDAGVKERAVIESKKRGYNIIFRDQAYADARNRFETPLAFVSHDSRDKEEIAGPLALELQKLMCPVWYDEYSLKIGDSLREQIEKGLKECKKCILILTPNYLANEGWGKKEFDSVFTRELIETKKVILPVWHGVTKEQIYEYSPSLADRVAANWTSGVSNVARKLKQALS